MNEQSTMPTDETLIAAITEHQPASFHKLCSLWDVDWDGDPDDLSVWNARKQLKRQLQNCGRLAAFAQTMISYG